MGTGQVPWEADVTRWMGLASPMTFGCGIPSEWRGTTGDNLKSVDTMEGRKRSSGFPRP